MKRASISHAKSQLSALLDRVRHGETIVIEDRGVPVAQLVPVAGRATTSDSDRLARLERQGILRPPLTSKPVPLLKTPPRARARTRGTSLSQLVRAERDEGR
jgi:prevent-host-death family protein